MLLQAVNFTGYPLIRRTLPYKSYKGVHPPPPPAERLSVLTSFQYRFLGNEF